MPVYNARRFVWEATDSILQQTFRDFEFLIFDDGSTDGSLRTLRDFASRDNRIRLFCDKHRGLVTWLNSGIETARGEFYARMDADDVALPTRLERQVAFLQEHPEIVGVGCQTLTISPSGAPIRQKQLPLEPEQIERRLLKGYAALAHPTAMIRVSALKRLGGYRNEYAFVEDIDLFLRLSEKGRLANLPDVLLHYRVHMNSVCHKKAEIQRDRLISSVREAHRRRGLKAPDQVPGAAHKKIRSPLDWHYRFARMAIQECQWTAAFGHALSALRLAPLKPHSWRVLLGVLLRKSP